MWGEENRKETNKMYVGMFWKTLLEKTEQGSLQGLHWELAWV